MLHIKHRVQAIILVIMAFTVTTAQALDNPTGPYIGLRGGLNLIKDLNPQDQYQPRVPISWEYEKGYNIAAVAGYKLSENLRLELEINRVVNDLENFSVNGAVSNHKVMDTTAYTYLFNAYWEFPLFAEFPLIPYIGAGIGVSKLVANGARVTGGGATVLVPDSSDSDFTYQFGFGATWEFEEYMAVDLGYRYLATENPKWGNISAEHHTNSILAGIRRHF